MSLPRTSVGPLIERFSGRRQFSSGDVPMPSSTPPVFRHGSVEPGLRSVGRPRRRSRERGDTSRPRVERTLPSGPEETSEWMEALTDLEERYQSLERQNRMLGSNDRAVR